MIGKIFQSAKPGANGLKPPSKDDFLKVENAFETEIKKLLEDRSQRVNGGCWGWKANGTCLAAPLFLKYLKEPRLIIVFRNTLNIAKSVVRYSQAKSPAYEPLNLREALFVTQQYFDNILWLLEQYPDLPTLFVSFKEVVSSPLMEAERIASFLGLDLTNEKAGEIRRFVGFTKGQKALKQAKRFEDFLRKIMPRSVKELIKKVIKRES